MVAANDLDSLRDELSLYSDQHLAGDLDNQRLAVGNALVGVAKYLEAQGFAPAAILLVMRPAIALAEREQNSAHDQMFTQRPREGRLSRTFDERMRTASGPIIRLLEMLDRGELPERYIAKSKPRGRPSKPKGDAGL